MSIEISIEDGNECAKAKLVQAIAEYIEAHQHIKDLSSTLILKLTYK